MRGRRLPGIPLLPSPLVGRQGEIAVARAALLDHDVRLLTLTGPPGVGKTSLALAVGRGLGDRFRDGAAFVDLSAVSDPGLVAQAIGDTLAVTGPARRPLDRLLAWLRERQVLLVVDNFEQVVSAAPVISNLLGSCPRLTVIATSRVPLRLRWERELPVPPLGLPDLTQSSTAATLAQAPAVALFVERARSVSPAFQITDENAPVVAQVCARLDGLPLAIELAAARIRVLSPRSLHAQLVDNRDRPQAGPAVSGASRLQVLAGGPRDLPARQQTLRDAIAWSHDLLTDEERTVFRRLAVFAGGCALPAACAVAGDGNRTGDVIASLVEQSLLRQELAHQDEPRFRMLETIQQFARERLEASEETAAIERRHAEVFVSLAEQAEPELRGARQVEWLDRLERERDNFGIAARRAAERGDAETIVRLGAALWRFWFLRGDAAEARERIEGVLSLARAVPPVPARARALYGAGVLARQLGDYASARQLFQESLDVGRAVNDRHAVANALVRLAALTYIGGAYREAEALCSEGLAMLRDLGDRHSIAEALEIQGFIAYLRGDLESAVQWLGESLAIAREIGSAATVINALSALGLCYHVQRDLLEARRLYEECLALTDEVGDPHATAMVSNNLAHVATLQRDIPTARRTFGEGLRVARSSGNRRRLAFILRGLAGLVAAEGDPALAIRLDTAGDAAVAAMGAKLAIAMHALYEEGLEPARTALDERAADEARALGLATPLDEAVEFALSWLGPDAPTGVGDDAPAMERVVDRTPPTRSDRPSPSTRDSAPDAGVLTRRERDVAALLGRGYTNRQIADTLVVTEGTAANYVRRVMDRLDLHRRSQVAAWAVERRLHELQVESERR